jgi:hypothetical protein
MMTIDEWRKREDLQLELRECLKQPALAHAFEVLVDFALPKAMPVPQGTDIALWGALQNARREGFYDCLRNFGALTNLAEQPAVLPEPWTENKGKNNE